MPAPFESDPERLLEELRAQQLAMTLLIEALDAPTRERLRDAVRRLQAGDYPDTETEDRQVCVRAAEYLRGPLLDPEGE